MQALNIYEVLMSGAQASVHRGKVGTIPVAVKKFGTVQDRNSEMQILKQLEDVPGVVRLIDTPVEDGIVMELLP